MLFCSEAFLGFFLCVFLTYWALPSTRARIWLLVIASFFFYASWNKWLACLIGVSTVIDFVLARSIDASSNPRLRKVLLTINIVGNLGLLCYFKYANFFLDSLQTSLSMAGVSSTLPALSVILPVGISFYTFEAINYMIDVYRGKIRAERNLAHFMLFITFFPHLVAGPIVRAKDFLPQIARPKTWDWARIRLGVQFFLLGMFKKVIADRMAPYVDPVFAHPSDYGTHNLWIGVVAYAIQIYCDFSGYTDMAIGCAHMLGFKLAPNFNMPYLASNISEFWRRWHISLSSWLRDYLFIPLGGSRGGELATARNLLITMTLGGLWHGASWTFVVWGIVHGLLLIGHRQFRRFADAHPVLDRFLATSFGTMVSTALTLFIVALTWIPFRAQTFADMATVFTRMFTPATRTAFSPGLVAPVLLACLALAVGHWLGTRRWLGMALLRMPAPTAGIVYGVQFSLTLLLMPASGQAFIYFQF